MAYNNTDMLQARKNKSDEFYTQLEDIEKELAFYKTVFRDKVVYCSSDLGGNPDNDPSVSNFFKYFFHNFEKLGLKKLITTCYSDCNEATFSKFDNKEMKVRYLQGNGDFRNQENIEFLKEADIVVTNPPFSLFREFTSQLIEYEKQFLIIGNVGAVGYKNTFPLFRDDKIWFGPSIHSGDREFAIPDTYPITTTGFRIDNTGKRFIKVKGVRWFTNIETIDRDKDLVLEKTYSSNDYNFFDNFDAINVNRVADIPVDYKGVMGVPITFLDKYNPKQFDILGLTIRNGDLRSKIYSAEDSPNWRNLNACCVIKNAGEYKTVYIRVLIRRK